MNIADAESVIIEMQATWPQRAFDEAQTIVWLKTLEPLSIDVARAAVNTLRKTATFMPSHAEFTTSAEHERKRLLALALPPADDRPCPECGDARFVELRHDTVRPCSRCRTVEYARWAEGHYGPSHSDKPCTDCNDFRSGGDRATERAQTYTDKAARFARGAA